MASTMVFSTDGVSRVDVHLHHHKVLGARGLAQHAQHARAAKRRGLVDGHVVKVQFGPDARRDVTPPRARVEWPSLPRPDAVKGDALARVEAHEELQRSAESAALPPSRRIPRILVARTAPHGAAQVIVQASSLEASAIAAIVRIRAAVGEDQVIDVVLVRSCR